MSTISGARLPTADRNAQDRLVSTATTKVSLNGELRWNGIYQCISMGQNANEPTGNFRIDMPADGALISVVGGAARAVVPATAGSSVLTGGILLNAWDALWYKHNAGASNATVPANFLIVPLAQSTNSVDGPFLDPQNWVRVATRDSDNGFHLFTGEAINLCGQIGRSNQMTESAWATMKLQATSDGYFFCPGGDTATGGAFGFTGTIRWIGGGNRTLVNNLGFRDIGQAQKAVGASVRGVFGAATRAWRLMISAEKPGWFGGAQRGVNPILAASTTVVSLNGNEILYWAPNIDGITTTEGEWIVAGYAGSGVVPTHWLPVASRQSSFNTSEIQVLVGGMQYGLRPNDFVFGIKASDFIRDAEIRRAGIMHKGLKYCRWSQAAFFAGAAANGNLGSTAAVLVSWDDNNLIYGISDGYVSWGNQYSYINPPAVGTEIPVVVTNSNVTRVVQNISGRRYIPLGNWEALYWIPPAYIAGGVSAAGDFVIGYYNSNHGIPASAVLVAKVEGAGAFPSGSSVTKNRVKFADSTYIQPGVSLATGTPAQNDHAQGSGDWRPLVYPGQTGPGMTAAMPATPGVGGAYSAPFTAFYNYRSLDDDPRGNIHLEGLILLNGSITGTQRIAFLPGVNVRGEPIVTVPIMHSTGTDAKMVNGQLRFQNTTINGSSGVQLMAHVNSFNTALNPYFTLGVNGGALAQGVPNWVSLSNIILPHS